MRLKKKKFFKNVKETERETERETECETDIKEGEKTETIICKETETKQRKSTRQITLKQMITGEKEPREIKQTNRKVRKIKETKTDKNKETDGKRPKKKTLPKGQLTLKQMLELTKNIAKPRTNSEKRETETGIKTDPTVKYQAEKTDETGDNNISNSQQHSKNLSHKRSKMESPVLPGLKPENSEKCPRNQAKNRAEKVVSNKLNAGQFILKRKRTEDLTEVSKISSKKSKPTVPPSHVKIAPEGWSPAKNNKGPKVSRMGREGGTDGSTRTRSENDNITLSAIEDFSSLKRLVVETTSTP